MKKLSAVSCELSARREGCWAMSDERELRLSRDAEGERAAAQLVAELDQRWARARDWMWDQPAAALVALDRLLHAQNDAGLARAMVASPQVARGVRLLAKLAFDELLVRARGNGDEGSHEGHESHEGGT